MNSSNRDSSNKESSNLSVKRSYDQQASSHGRGGGLDQLQLDSEQLQKASTRQQSTTFALLLNQLQQQQQQHQQRPNNNTLNLPFNPQAFGAPQQQQRQQNSTTQPESTRSALQALGFQKLMDMDRQNPSAVVHLLMQAAQKQHQQQQQMNSMPTLNSQPSVTNLNPNQQPQPQSMPHLSLHSSCQIQEKAELKEHHSETSPPRKRRRVVKRVMKPKPDPKKPSKVPSTVPCRCRGMPNDHTPKTAFIVIPEDVTHGQALKCSHPICQKRGVRFRYCEVCETPVAKRNFSTRHNHPPGEFPEAIALEARAQEEEEALEKKTKVDLEEDEEEGDEDMAGGQATTSSFKLPQDTDRSIASLIAAATNQHQAAANVNLSARGTKATNEDSSIEEQDGKHPKKSKNNMLMARVYRTPQDPPDLAKYGSKRRMEWLTLLGQRPPPDRPELMPRWLHQLMVVSDLSRPWKVTDQDPISDMAESSSEGTARSTSSGDESRSPQESSKEESG